MLFWFQRQRLPVTAAVLIAVVLGACGRNDDPVEPTTEPALAGGLVRSDSPIIGPTDAPVTMVEFLDPECESCRAAFPDIKRLMAQYPTELRLVVRYFPLHANSVLAAIATEAAGEQGKYAQMQELLFERQPEWGEQTTPQTERFKQYANELGLDLARFDAAMTNPQYRQKVERDKADGIAIGVTSTPTFFVDGRWIQTPSPAALKAAINAALRR